MLSFSPRFFFYTILVIASFMDGMGVMQNFAILAQVFKEKVFVCSLFFRNVRNRCKNNFTEKNPEDMLNCSLSCTCSLNLRNKKRLMILKGHQKT